MEIRALEPRDEDALRSFFAAIPEFLGAATLEHSAEWRAAREVDAAEAAQQVRSDGMGALPWGAVSAIVRQLVP